jgi:DNA-binding response OmpR family regulator
MRLLLAEDNDRLQELLGEAIRRAGYRLDIVATVDGLLGSAEAVNYDLAIIDLGLPDGDGLDAIRTLRARGETAPILIITARERVDDRILGLDSGADDYLTKPFNHGEFLARVRALLRRPLVLAGPLLRAGALDHDEATGRTRLNGRDLELRASERRLLALLMRRADAIVAKPAIEEALSQFGRELSSNAVEILISRLRKAIGSADGISIETVRGIGYVLRTAGN